MKKVEIELLHIQKRYEKVILKDINLKINNESFVTVVGDSGSGKSTLMNILGLIENHDGGEYIFNGKNIKSGKDYSDIRGANIGFVFQSYHLIPALTCRENIELPILYLKKREKINNYDNIVKELKIENLMEKRVNTLSGGEKQRVAVARALIRNPGLIIADEPTGNLDEKNKWIVYNLLRKEHEKGRGVIIITHDKELAMKANIQYILKEGRLIQNDKNN